jgi:hypothetical protein
VPKIGPTFGLHFVNSALSTTSTWDQGRILNNINNVVAFGINVNAQGYHCLSFNKRGKENTLPPSTDMLVIVCK